MDRISLDIDAVTELVDEIAKAAILPRFRRLSREGVEHKSTPADPDDIAASDQESGGSTLLKPWQLPGPTLIMLW